MGLSVPSAYRSRLRIWVPPFLQTMVALPKRSMATCESSI